MGERVTDKEFSSGSDIYQKQPSKEVLCGDIDQTDPRNGQI